LFDEKIQEIVVAIYIHFRPLKMQQQGFERKAGKIIMVTDGQLSPRGDNT